MKIKDDDIEKFNSTLGTHSIVRDEGNYFGSCIFFNPPALIPIGYNNMV